jgi:hypothetical protein
MRTDVGHIKAEDEPNSSTAAGLTDFAPMVAKNCFGTPGTA